MQAHALRSFAKRLLAICATLVVTLGAGPAISADFPQKPINIVSPFPPGGAADVLARLVGDQLGKELGQSVVVENRAGASTVIGASFVARARPDGYTLLLATNTTLVTNRSLFKELAYDPDAFEPLGMLSVVPMVVLGSKKSRFEDFPEMIQYAKDNPGALTFASVGVGTTSHLALEQLRQMTGIELTHAPFNGASQIFPALINGDVDAFFDTVSTGMPQVKGGKLNALAISSRERTSSYPEVPTIAEQGFPEFDMNIWFSLMAPAGTPPEILAVLRDAVQRTMTTETLRKRITDLGMDPTDTDPALLTAQIQREVPMIEKLVNNAGIEKK